MFFERIYDKSLAQSSYLIGCQQTGEAIVIDAKRDIDTYLDIARQNNLRISHVAETHIHADFLCGSRELASVTGAGIYLSDEGGEDWQYAFPHTGLRDGNELKVGNLSLKAIHTPGHTPESLSFLLTDCPASEEPVMVFTGDFVFVGDVGRPDLLEAAGIKNTKEKGARQLFHSLQKFRALPDFVQVWPGHGAGSACGKSLGAVPSSTVGYEKKSNWALQFGTDEEGFVEALLDGQPEPPKYFAMMKHLNKVKRPLLVEVPKPTLLTKEQFISAYKKGIKIIDTRPKDDFARMFLRGAINIQGKDSFSTWMGWLLNYEEQFILLGDEEQMDDLSRKLMRIGMDNLYGYFFDVGELIFDLEERYAEVIDMDEFKNYIGKPDVQILDVRGKSEYKISHIDGAENLFVGTLKDNLDKVSKDKQVIVHCKSGDRSTIAQSILMKNGFENVKNFSGGMDEWMAKSEEAR